MIKNNASIVNKDTQKNFLIKLFSFHTLLLESFTYTFFLNKCEMGRREYIIGSKMYLQIRKIMDYFH